MQLDVDSCRSKGPHKKAQSMRVADKTDCRAASGGRLSGIVISSLEPWWAGMSRRTESCRSSDRDIGDWSTFKNDFDWTAVSSPMVRLLDKDSHRDYAYKHGDEAGDLGVSFSELSGILIPLRGWWDLFNVIQI